MGPSGAHPLKHWFVWSSTLDLSSQRHGYIGMSPYYASHVAQTTSSLSKAFLTTFLFEAASLHKWLHLTSTNTFSCVWISVFYAKHCRYFIFISSIFIYLMTSILIRYLFFLWPTIYSLNELSCIAFLTWCIRWSTVKGQEAGHLRVKGPWAIIHWSFTWPVCLRLQTSTLRCCMKHRKARNLVWFGLDEWFPTWPEIWKWPGDWPPTHLPDYNLHNHHNVNATYFYMLGYISQIFSGF